MMPPVSRYGELQDAATHSLRSPSNQRHRVPVPIDNQMIADNTLVSKVQDCDDCGRLYDSFVNARCPSSGGDINDNLLI